MRFTKLSMALAISLVLSATTCNGQDVTNPYSGQQQQQPTGDQPGIAFREESKTSLLTPPTNDAQSNTSNNSFNVNESSHNNINAVSRRHHRRHHLSPNLRNDIQQPPIIQALYTNKKRSSWESAPVPVSHVRQRERIQGYKRRSRMMKREEPRRLAGERRAGLLDSIVDDMGQPPAGSTSSSPPDSNESSSENESTPSSSDEAADEPTSINPSDDVEPTSTTEEPIAVVTTTLTVPITTDPAPGPVSAPTPTPVDPPTSATNNNRDNNNGNNNNNYVENERDGSKSSTPELITKGPAQPTNVGSHKAGDSNATAVTAGVVMVTILIVGVIGVWVFRKWKLSPSRQFKSKISGGTDGGASAGSYGAGHDDVSGYNNYDEFFRRQSTPSVHDPSALPPMSCATSVAGVAMSPYNPPYPPHHHQHHMSISSASGSAIAADYNQYQQPYNAYDAPGHLAPAPSTIGGVPVAGHKIHSYGSDDFNQNHNFLRELRGT